MTYPTNNIHYFVIVSQLKKEALCFFFYACSRVYVYLSNSRHAETKHTLILRVLNYIHFSQWYANFAFNISRYIQSQIDFIFPSLYLPANLLELAEY